MGTRNQNSARRQSKGRTQQLKETPNQSGQKSTVSVGRVPGKIREIEYAQGMTVGSALKRAEINTNSCEIQRNGQTAKLTDDVNRGDSILAIAKIRGN